MSSHTCLPNLLHVASPSGRTETDTPEKMLDGRDELLDRSPVTCLPAPESLRDMVERSMLWAGRRSLGQVLVLLSSTRTGALSPGATGGSLAPGSYSWPN